MQQTRQLTGLAGHILSYKHTRPRSGCIILFHHSTGDAGKANESENPDTLIEAYSSNGRGFVVVT